MTRTADVSPRGPVFHLLCAAARPCLRLLPGRLLPGAPFPYEAVDDSPDARQRIASFRCGRPAGWCREDHARQQAPRHRWVVTSRFRTRLARTRLPRTRLARARVAVCGSVRNPVSPAAPSPSLLPERFPTRLARRRAGVFYGRRKRRPYPRFTRTRDAVCGSVRIPVPPGDGGGQDPCAPGYPSSPGVSARSIRPSRYPLPATPSPRPMPDRFRIRLSRTRDGVCGSVRIQDGPHPSRKDTRP